MKQWGVILFYSDNRLFVLRYVDRFAQDLGQRRGYFVHIRLQTCSAAHIYVIISDQTAPIIVR